MEPQGHVMSEFREVCEQAARSGGSVLQAMRGRTGVREKAPKDVVTEADYASQEAVRAVIARAFPAHGFLGEEEDGAVRPPVTAATVDDCEYCWLVDPLDGTLNYTRQLPNYAVSVACVAEAE